MVYNPLLERFLNPPEVHEAGRPYAYDLTLGDEDIEGLPQHVNLEVICSLEYMRFSTGVSSVYAIVNVSSLFYSPNSRTMLTKRYRLTASRSIDGKLSVAILRCPR